MKLEDAMTIWYLSRTIKIQAVIPRSYILDVPCTEEKTLNRIPRDQVIR